MRFCLASLCLTLFVGCVAEPPASESRQAVRVPGPWVAPPDVQAAAAGQFVPVVDPPAVSDGGSCSSNNAFECSCTHTACTPAHPGTNELREYLLGRFEGIRNSGTYCCRQNSGRLSHMSVHAIGRAIDLGVTTISGDADNTIGDEVANFLVTYAEYIGIQRVIWDHTFWNGERGFGSLGGNPHVDHLHIELSQAGAARQTSFFTIGAPGTTCTPECSGSRLIASDCSSIDCAQNGAECLAGPPPACGEPPPPEPPSAVVAAGAAFPSLATVGEPGRVTFAGPDRLFDTRASMDGLTFDDGLSELTWASGYPAAVTGAWLNLAVVATEPGFITAFSTGSTRPDTSNINTSGRVRSNLVPVMFGTDQSVTFFELNPVELIGDVYATLGPAGEGLELVDPVRAYDSRSIEMPLVADEITVLDVGAPAGATGVLGSLAALQPELDGFVSVFPCGADPETSTVNVAANEIASNQVITALGDNGRICLRSIRDMNAVFDVIGFFSPEGLLEYQALTPTRLVDTRNSVYFENRLAAQQTVELPLGTAPGMPENGWAAVFNVATIDSDGPGHLTVFACERGTPPPTSAHNFSADVRATLVTSALGTSRRACVRTSTRAHIVVDLLGLWLRGDGAPPPDPEPIPEPDPDPIDPDGDAGPPSEIDAGPPSEIDAGPGGEIATGCGCRVPTGPSDAPWAPLALLGLAVFVRRTR